MKVYSVLGYTQYEGFEFFGVHASREEAVSWLKSYEGYQRRWGDRYGVVESDLGEMVDSHDQIEYVDYE